MPLRDERPFEEWVQRENPSYVVGRVVNWWIVQAGYAPWLAPSVPWPEMSDAASEVRSAVVPGTNVEVFYRETFVPEGVGPVDLILVRSIPPRPSSD